MPEPADVPPPPDRDSEVAALRERVAALEHELARWRGITRQVRALIVTTDLEGRITEFNREAQRVLEYSPAEVLGQPADLFYVGQRTRAKLLEKLSDKPGGVVRGDVRVRTKSGRLRWLALSLSWLRDPRDQIVGTVGVSRDVTKRRELEEKLRRLSITDKLTGLFNQSHFFQRLEIEKERALRLDHELALLLFDLDGFKALNDTQGHLEGDRVLRRVGRILFESVRKEVDAAFRYGGDEFTVLLPGATSERALRFAERIRSRIEAGEGGVTASMGICPFDRGNRALQLIEKADEAMYAVKRAGGNKVAVFDPSTGGVVVHEPSAR